MPNLGMQTMYLKFPCIKNTMPNLDMPTMYCRERELNTGAVSPASLIIIEKKTAEGCQKLTLAFADAPHNKNPHPS